MNKLVPPKQLSLGAEMTREDMLLQELPPNIDPKSPQFRADLEKVDRIDLKNAEFDKPEERSDANGGKVLLAPASQATEAWIDPASNDLLIEQLGWPDENAVIRIAAPLIPQFIDSLCDLIGVASFGGR